MPPGHHSGHSQLRHDHRQGSSLSSPVTHRQKHASKSQSTANGNTARSTCLCCPLPSLFSSDGEPQSLPCSNHDSDEQTRCWQSLLEESEEIQTYPHSSKHSCSFTVFGMFLQRPFICLPSTQNLQRSWSCFWTKMPPLLNDTTSALSGNDQ